MGKRPTDDEEPNAKKKRGASKQITQDDDFEREEEGEEQGTFARASEATLASRRILKARRPPPRAPDAPPAFNPFAGVSLTPAAAPAASPETKAASTLPTPAPASSPASPSAVPASTSESQASPSSTAAVETTEGSGSTKKEKEASPAKESKPEASSPPPPYSAGAPSPVASAVTSSGTSATFSVPSTFSGLFSGPDPSATVASTSAPVTGLNTPPTTTPVAASGSAASAFLFRNNGGGFGALSSAGGGFGFGASAAKTSFGDGKEAAEGTEGAKPTEGFSFSTISGGGFPSLKSIFKVPSGGTMVGAPGFGNQASGACQSGSLSGGGAGGPGPVLMSKEPVVTGEEEDECLFNETAQLFEYEGAAWKGRGKGFLRVSRHKTTSKARLVMKGHNGLHLLLNANIWDGMKFAPMEGTKHGVTFACINHANQTSEADKDVDKDKLVTYAIRLNSKDKNADDQLERFLSETEACLKKESNSEKEKEECPV